MSKADVSDVVIPLRCAQVQLRGSRRFFFFASENKNMTFQQKGKWNWIKSGFLILTQSCKKWEHVW